MFILRNFVLFLAQIMKLLVRFFLSLSLVFLLCKGSIGSQPAPHACATGIAPASLSSKTITAGISNLTTGRLPFRRFVHPGVEKQREEAKATETDDDDEDPLSFKKFLKTGHRCIAAVYAPIIPGAHLDTQPPLPLCNHFSHSASPKYLLLRTLRI